MPGEGHGGPARKYTWAPFEPGHTLSLQHGGYSPRVYGDTAEALVAWVLEQRPHLAPYSTAVAAWAELEARCGVLRAHLDEHGMLDDRGRPRPAVELLLRLERQADRARQRLGLDPRADVDLVKATAETQHLTSDLDAIREAGRKALETAERAEVISAEADPPKGARTLSDDHGGSRE
jgi:hypothetical protein